MMALEKKVELIPFEAFKEAIINSLVDRIWNIKANTQIEMHPDKIIVSYPGDLISNMIKKNYMNGNYSDLSNNIIANVFRRLNIIEEFATGINESYKNYIVKPIYRVLIGAISITLPIIDQINLSLDEKKIYDLMKMNYSYSRMELEKLRGFTKSKLIRILNSLITKQIIEKTGNTRLILYSKK